MRNHHLLGRRSMPLRKIAERIKRLFLFYFTTFWRLNEWRTIWMKELTCEMSEFLLDSLVRPLLRLCSAVADFDVVAFSLALLCWSSLSSRLPRTILDIINIWNHQYLIAHRFNIIEMKMNKKMKKEQKNWKNSW